MALPKAYDGQRCSLARSLEIIGERWTLLIVRDAFFGVRRFSDFVTHMDVPRAVLSDRLSTLVDAGVFTTTSGAHGHTEYVLTDKGLSLWPVVRSLLDWGAEHYSPNGPARLFRHQVDDGAIGTEGRCETCGAMVAVADTVMVPGPGLSQPQPPDFVSGELTRPRRLLEPVRASS